jgi:hypothetical protein
MSPLDAPPDQPTFFTDRGLGSRMVPAGLRAAGLRITVMQDYYGAAKAECLEDQEWIADVTDAGMVVLTKDANMRFNRLVVRAIVKSGARCFALPRQDLTGAQMAARFIDNRQAILDIVTARAGPYFFHVHRDHVDEMPLPRN